jgi:hypothetical protein
MVISSDYQRTAETARYFLMGMYALDSGFDLSGINQEIDYNE